MILLIGLLFSIVLIFFIGALSMSVGIFLDITSLLIVLLPVIFFLCISKAGKALARYIKTSFRKNPQYSTEDLDSIAAAAKKIRKIIMAAGWFGFFMGLCAIFSNIGDENLALILMRNMSVALITVIYAFALSFFIFFPLQAWAENKIASFENK